MDNKPYSHFDYLTSLFTESPKYFYSDCIAELWAAIPEKVYEENEPFWLIRDNHKKQIEDAIVNGELEGIIEERIEGSKDDGFQEITDKNRIRKIEKGRLGNNYVVFTVYHDKFKDWLIKSNQWPLADDCLLNKWFEGEAEAVEDVGMNSSAPDTRQSQLYIFIWRVYQTFLSRKNKMPTAQQVWSEIQHHHAIHDTEEIIQEVTGNLIEWRSGYGNEQKLTRNSFDKTLSNIKSKPPL